MIMKRKTTRKKSAKRSMLPSWNEVRMGLSQVSKLRLLFLLAKVYRSSVVPRSVKVNILTMARTGAKKVKTKRKVTRKKPRSAAQKRATRKLVALNKRRRR
tara:strand:- start:1013 stop:1315 length:303 start_codon:yes stop_codon:yes gene_type:complete